MVCARASYSIRCGYWRASLALSLLIVFLAAIVRGFSGFGFSLLAISALSLLYPPQQIFPPIFLMEIAASLHLLPSVWRHIHWRSMAPLLAGHVAPGGALVLAGVLERQTAELQAAYRPWLSLEVADTEDGWVLLVARRA